ncbi:PKD domain-containing protein [Euzebya tangerina]|uniref:PKD domain-containing protein n=1 Tax=Euzebya tangerina TaxID=591198 RepID=UPI000E321C91|nr:PKD domain-containing protein [Euzebya tangerina]
MYSFTSPSHPVITNRIRTVLQVGLLLALVVMLAASLLTPAAAVSDTQDVVVSDDPDNNTPHALDGRVLAIMPVGDRVVVGGTFTQIATVADRDTPIARNAIFAFDPETGEIDQNFQPEIDGTIETLAASPDGNSVYIGGAYSEVNGQTEWRLTRLNMADGSIDPSFDVTPNSKVRDIVLAGDRLYVGGTFTMMDQEVRTAFAAVDATTGDVLDEVDLTFSDQARGSLAVFKLDVTPDQSQVAVIGNFGRIDGQSREFAALIDVADGPAELADWQTNRYGMNLCASAFDSYMRDVEISPDGGYMIIVTTGAYRANRLCDSIARWDLDVTGSDLQPTWANLSGGDTFYSVAVTGEAVYVGGHFRWLNNPFANNWQGPGSVTREGIGAVDPVNGLPLAWDPGRERGVGAFDLVTSDDGLYVGSDTDRIGNFEFHGRLARFPLDGGAQVLRADPGPLPGVIFVGDGADLDGRTFDGAAVGPASATSVNWSGVRAAMMLSGRLYTASSDGVFRVRDFDGTSAGTPETVDLNGLRSSYFPVSSLTGMTMDRTTGRMYYTVQGRTELFYRYFLADSNTVGAEEFVASTSVAGIGGQYLTGMHLHEDTLYFSAVDGYLRQADFQDGVAVAGTVTAVNGPPQGNDWSGQGLFLLSEDGYQAPNLLPEPTIRSVCTDDGCRFGSTGSGDADGWIETFEWDFGDGATATGPGVSHVYTSDGTFTVTLTATDNEGGVSTTTTTVERNGPPVADAAISCINLDCTFDGSASSDGGTITAFDWDFGDGAGGTGEATSHTYAAAGTYDVQLTVTDDTGLTDSVVQQIQVSEPADEITHLGTAAVNGNQQSFTVDVPDATRGGDLLLLFASFNNSDTNHQPEELGGWTQLDTVVNGPLRSSVWWRVAEPGDENSTETLTTGSFFKGDVALVAYSGTSTTVPVAVAEATAESGSTSSHITPIVSNPLAEATLVSYWVDRTGSNSNWTEPAGTTVVHEGIGLGGGRISALIGEQAAAAGDTGGLTATSVTTTNRAAMWSLVLAPFGVDTVPDQAPTAVASGSCERLTCAVTGSGSSDPEGPIASYSWDMGDGTQLPGPTPQHSYAAAGEYTVTLTVTDGEGQTATTTIQLTATAPPDEITFKSSDTDNGNRSAFWVTVPEDVLSGDLLVLTGSWNNGTIDPDPVNLPGWNRLDSVSTDRIRTSVWWRIANTADGGVDEVLDVGRFVKGDVALLVYEGVDATNPVEVHDALTETSDTTDHTAPVVTTTQADSLVLNYWTDRTSSTTDWTEPAGTTVVHEGIGAGGGRSSGLITEALSGAAGDVGGGTASADGSTQHATMWTIVLSPA